MGRLQWGGGEWTLWGLKIGHACPRLLPGAHPFRQASDAVGMPCAVRLPQRGRTDTVSLKTRRAGALRELPLRSSRPDLATWWWVAPRQIRSDRQTVVLLGAVSLRWLVPCMCVVLRHPLAHQRLAHLHAMDSRFRLCAYDATFCCWLGCLVWSATPPVQRPPPP